MSGQENLLIYQEFMSQLKNNLNLPLSPATYRGSTFTIHSSEQLQYFQPKSAAKSAN